MASHQKRGKRKQAQGEPAADYYKLKTQAVDDLVHADASNSPTVSEEELRKYRAHSGIKLSNWLKVCLIKFWFAGAMCFFFIWGLGTYVSDLLDLLVITGLALGASTDLLTNNVLRFIAETPGGNDRWMMFPQKKFITLFQNILYSCVVLFLVFSLYNIINMVLIAATGAAADSVPLGVEPILFGLFYMLFDMLLIECKHLCVKLFTGNKNV